MGSRRFLVLLALVTTAAAFFFIGVFHAHANDRAEHARYEAKLDAIRIEVQNELGRGRFSLIPAATTGQSAGAGDDRQAGDPVRAKMVAEIKQELQAEMGLLPVHLFRE